ncbi:hypothetical protein BSKO_10964 [Bryopsis sp. KO-2023]|nr:hypothetical protein BSKO_10964 [Bryopsis sp. KO-2023]
MACWLPSLCLDQLPAQRRESDGPAKLLSKADQKKMLKIAVADLDLLPKTSLDILPKTPCGSQTSFPTPCGSHASFPETSPPLSPQLPKDVPRSFLCPISLDLMKDPVMLVETMQTYDRTSICRWFDWGGAICPVAGKQLVSQEMVNNPALRSAITEWKESGWKSSSKAGLKGVIAKGKTPTNFTHVRRPAPPTHLCSKPPKKVHSPAPLSPDCKPVVQNRGAGASRRESLVQPTFPSNSMAGFLGDAHQVPQWHMGQVSAPQSVGIGAVFVNEILQQRASVHGSNHAGWTALHWAAMEDDFEAVQLLIHLGAHMQKGSTKEVFVEGQKVFSGANPLHVAATFGSDRAAQVLVSCGAALEARSNFETPMQIAARLGHAAVIEVLARNGGDVNARDRSKETPLHLAVLKGHFSVVEVLLRFGADGSAVNGRGKRASELVTDRCNYFDQFSNLSPLDEFRMMELLEQSPAIGESLN